MNTTQNSTGDNGENGELTGLGLGMGNKGPDSCHYLVKSNMASTVNTEIRLHCLSYLCYLMFNCVVKA